MRGQHQQDRPDQQDEGEQQPDHIFAGHPDKIDLAHKAVIAGENFVMIGVHKGVASLKRIKGWLESSIIIA